jgi:hypothetical protein
MSEVTTTSTTNAGAVGYYHPYRAAGVVLVIIGILFIAYDLLVYARCSVGRGVCFDLHTHMANDIALLLFFIVFLIGLALLAYTAPSMVVSRQTVSAPVAPAPVAPATAPAAGTTVNVYPAGSNPTVVQNPPVTNPPATYPPRNPPPTTGP